jgi:hypothetical protein
MKFGSLYDVEVKLDTAVDTGLKYYQEKKSTLLTIVIILFILFWSFIYDYVEGHIYSPIKVTTAANTTHATATAHTLITCPPSWLWK